MALAYLLALQAAAASPVPFGATDFDLARYRPANADPARSRECARGQSEEVVVCGRRLLGGDYPLAHWARIFAVTPLIAQRRLSGNATAAIEGEQVDLGQGVVSNRMLVRIRVGF